jgi:hypothetical protein
MTTIRVARLENGQIVVREEPAPEPGPAPVPQSVTPAQMRLALHRAGLLATVQAIANSDPEAAIVWEYATAIVRASPFIAALKGSAFSDAQIDDLFRAAAAIA